MKKKIIKAAYKNVKINPKKNMDNIEEKKNNTNDNKLRVFERYAKDILNTPITGKEINENYDDQLINIEESDIKLIAFYLPQFHPISENDKWWGKGFTEWTNVTKAVPQFLGHYQPHLPGELGFYDLRLVENIKRQVELAKNYGVYGFCFHYYWFSGKRLLEKPLDIFVEDKDIDFPFCLCWANENWTRRWDGAENDILIEQKYMPEDDIQFIKDLSKYIKDERYIKINGKPLIIVYKPAVLPNFKKMVSKWRKYCRENKIGEIWVLGVKAWETQEPQKFGLDGLLEFPPHCMSEYGCELINDRLEIVNPEFKGLVYDYEKFVEDEKYLFIPNYKLYKTVSPSWDNTARNAYNGTVFHNSSPSVYKKWLKKVLQHTEENFEDDKVVFINAWNEWAEAAHLEPDRKYGYQFLQATKEALIENKSEIQKNEIQKNIIYVSHDAHFYGAQVLSLNIIKTLKEHFGYNVEIICINGGVLLEEFKKYGNVYTLDGEYKSNNKINQLVCLLHKKGFNIAICNTVITGDLVEIFCKNKIKTISLVHELPGVIHQYSAEGKAKKIAEYADKVVFPSRYVYEKYLTVTNLKENKCLIESQGLYKQNNYKDDLINAKKILREKLNLSKDSKIVLAVGCAYKRKGIDLFAKVATKVRNQNSDIYFVWVGNRDLEFMNTIPKDEIDNLILVDLTSETSIYFAGADIYLMTSREDPFPEVIMLAMDVEVPVIGFKDAGGFVDIVTEKTGVLVDFLDINQMSDEVINLLKDEELRSKKGMEGRKLIENNYIFLDYVYKLLDLLGHKYEKVSAIVPNYNYAQYLKSRLDSIKNQTYPVYEIIFLDDCSTDNSIEIFEKYISENEEVKNKIKLVKNNENSGFVFMQWEKGISMTKGDLIWICEADDLCSNEFLKENMKKFNQDKEVVLSYTQSKQIDENGEILAENYFDYTNDIDKDKWKKPYIIDGIEEIKDALVVKNTIPNVSGTVFKKYDLTEILDELKGFKIAGDWFFYVWILQKGKIAYSNKSYNYHRRHSNSVIMKENKLLHYKEIVSLQENIIEMFQINKDTLQKVEEYRKFLRKYFDL